MSTEVIVQDMVDQWETEYLWFRDEHSKAMELKNTLAVELYSILMIRADRLREYWRARLPK